MKEQVDSTIKNLNASYALSNLDLLNAENVEEHIRRQLCREIAECLFEHLSVKKRVETYDDLVIFSVSLNYIPDDKLQTLKRILKEHDLD